MIFANFGLKVDNFLRFPFQVMISLDFQFKVTIFANCNLKQLSSNNFLKFHV